MAQLHHGGGEGDTLAARLDSVRSAIADAAIAAGRSPEEITTIVVTKFHPAQLVRDLWALGVREVGENRHQEARTKSEELADLDGLNWNFIGQLQSKKARQVRRYAASVHSLDRDSVIDALAHFDTEFVGPRPLPGFLQINLTDDPGRGGIAPADLEAAATRVLEAPALSLRGLMAVAPLGEDPRPAFARLRELSESLQTLAPEARELSAGMSHDFVAAITEGATHLRIGSAITGNRPA